jgi:hypothetical protein
MRNSCSFHNLTSTEYHLHGDYERLFEEDVDVVVAYLKTLFKRLPGGIKDLEL